MNHSDNGWCDFLFYTNYTALWCGPRIHSGFPQSWKVMEKKLSWKLKKINKVMETKKVMEKSWNLLGLPF